MPSSIVEMGAPADNLVVETVTSKHIDHVPLYRQAVRLGTGRGNGNQPEHPEQFGAIQKRVRSSPAMAKRQKRKTVKEHSKM